MPWDQFFGSGAASKRLEPACLVDIFAAQARTTSRLLALFDFVPAASMMALDRGCRDIRMNRAFMQLVGGPEESCRYLRAGRELATYELPLQQAVEAGTRIETHIDLASADGRTLHLAGSAAPILDTSGEIVGSFASFFDVTHEHNLSALRASAELERDIARDQERRGYDRVRFLADLGMALNGSLNVAAILQTLSDLLVPAHADCIAVDLLNGERGLESFYIYDHNPARLAAVRNVRASELDSVMPLVAQTITSLGIARFDEVYTASMRRLRELGLVRLVSAPMKIRGRTIGVLALLGEAARAYAPADVQIFQEVSLRAAVAIDNAQLYETQRDIAETLQHALLPAALPKLDELAFDAVYRPSEERAAVGGDWYDAHVLEDGRVLVTIGDVMGHGMDAAATMGHVRHLITALATAYRDPAEILDLADREVKRTHPYELVTAFVGIFDFAKKSFTHATAGHPAPFVVADGRVCQLRVRLDLPLGFRAESGCPSVRVPLVSGAVMVFYTDGLVECNRDVDAMERSIVETLELFGDDTTAKKLVNAILPDHTPDDVAVMTVRVQ